MANLLNINTWNVGTGSVTGFSDIYGTARRFYSPGPWTKDELIWEATSTGLTTQGNGGFASSTYLDIIDISYKYRLSVWANRKVLGTLGQVFFGMYAANISDAEVGLINIANDVSTTNPYLYWTSNPPTTNQLPVDTWILLVGYINPYGYTGTTINPTSGGYKIDGTKLSNTSAAFYEFKWASTHRKIKHRVYLYYSYPHTNPVQYFLYPRIDKCDGTEPSISGLISNKRYWLGLKTSNFNIGIISKNVPSN
jgi:hypothetical protein